MLKLKIFNVLLQKNIDLMTLCVSSLIPSVDIGVIKEAIDVKAAATPTQLCIAAVS